MADRRASDLKPWLAAFLFVALAAALRWGLGLLDPQLLKFATFYPAVLLAALVGGTGPGILAIVLSMLVGWFAIMPPKWSFAVISNSQIFDLILFALSTGVIVLLVAAYRREQTARELLVAEMEHRNRNTQATITSIITQTLHDGAAAEALIGRLTALFATNDVLTRSADQTATLDALLDSELAPFDRTRIDATGPIIILECQQARSISLMLHELTTNAAKYGALSSKDGRLRIAWRREKDQLNCEWLDFKWIEQGGPAVAEPNRKGFGTKLMAILVMQYEGTYEPDVTTDGFRCRLRCKLSQLTA